MDFSEALTQIKKGMRLAREGWNGKGLFIFLVNGSRFTVNREPLLSILGEGTEVSYNPHIDVRRTDGSISTWSPSNDDVLADDWVLVSDRS